MPYWSRVGHFSLKLLNAMNTQTINSRKINLSTQVKQILSEKGYSFLFNWSDYEHFKAQTKQSFNKAIVIAEMFISESNQNSDYNEYVF